MKYVFVKLVGPSHVHRVISLANMAAPAIPAVLLVKIISVFYWARRGKV